MEGVSRAILPVSPAVPNVHLYGKYGLRCKGQQIARTWHICGRGRPAVAPAHGPFNSTCDRD